MRRVVAGAVCSLASVVGMGAMVPGVEARIGVNRVAVILVQFDTEPSPSYSKAEAKRTIFSTAPDSVATYYGEASKGRKISITGRVFGSYKVHTSGQCDQSGWAAQAESQAVQKDQFAAADYDFIVVVLPGNGCQFAGGSTGKRVTVTGLIPSRIEHELGHSLGLGHSGALRCRTGSAPSMIGPQCTTNPYGDPFDVMGSGKLLFEPLHKEHLGVMTDYDAVKLNTRNSQTVTIDTAESGAYHRQALVIPRRRSANGTVLDNLFFEYRRPTGFVDNFALSDPAAKGVIATIGLESYLDTPDTNGRSWRDLFSGGSDSLLVDANPATVGNVTDAAFAAGQVFVDPYSGILVQPLRLTATDATLKVVFFTPSPW